MRGNLNREETQGGISMAFTFTDDFENALITQKNDIISIINEGISDPTNYIKAAQLLAFSRRLWVSVGYGYKFYELETRLRQAILDEIDGKEISGSFGNG
jgi:hypothetical protein